MHISYVNMNSLSILLLVNSLLPLSKGRSWKGAQVRRGHAESRLFCVCSDCPVCVRSACVLCTTSREPPVPLLTFTARVAFSFHWLHGYPLTKALLLLHSKSGQRQGSDAGLLFNHLAPSSQNPSGGITSNPFKHMIAFLDRKCFNLYFFGGVLKAR